MADRQVKRTGKDTDGDITKLCNGNATWSPVTKAQAIKDIDGGAHTYFVNEKGHRSKVITYVGKDGKTKHLTTEADGHPENNLDNLPDC